MSDSNMFTDASNNNPQEESSAGEGSSSNAEANRAAPLHGQQDGSPFRLPHYQQSVSQQQQPTHPQSSPPYTTFAPMPTPIQDARPLSPRSRRESFLRRYPGHAMQSSRPRNHSSPSRGAISQAPTPSSDLGRPAAPHQNIRSPAFGQSHMYGAQQNALPQLSNPSSGPDLPEFQTQDPLLQLAMMPTFGSWPPALPPMGYQTYPQSSLQPSTTAQDIQALPFNMPPPAALATNTQQQNTQALPSVTDIPPSAALATNTQHQNTQALPSNTNIPQPAALPTNTQQPDTTQQEPIEPSASASSKRRKTEPDSRGTQRQRDREREVNAALDEAHPKLNALIDLYEIAQDEIDPEKAEQVKKRLNWAIGKDELEKVKQMGKKKKEGGEGSSRSN